MGYNKYTFWQLISEKRIVIPIIQRDYAQGREGKEYVRKSFLEQLGNAIFKNGSIELDFVYGTEKDKTMYPLDGQQRLTTLWLLHWYVAYHAGKTNLTSFTEDEKKKLKNQSGKLENFEASKQEIVKTISTLKNFSYETRTSSREFCEKLCELEYKKTDNIVKHIMSQTWFFSIWKQDPTIQAMLRMLSGTSNTNNQDRELIDGIEILFENNKDFPAYWKYLTENNQITFNFLPLNSNEIPISDDLYIKMNARGKALTSFENFKADLIGWMKDSSNPEREVFNQLVDYDGRKMPYTLAFSSDIDNKWTDIFWENGKGLGRVDEIYFAFFNRYFYNLVITKDGFKDDNASQDVYYAYFSDLKNPKDNDKKIAYTSFDFYRHFLNSEIINDIYTILNNFYSSFRKCKNIHDILGCSWNKDFHFIPKFCKDGEEWKAWPNQSYDSEKGLFLLTGMGEGATDTNGVAYTLRAAYKRGGEAVTYSGELPITTEAKAQVGNAGFEEWHSEIYKFTATMFGTKEREWYLPWNTDEGDIWWAVNSKKTMLSECTNWNFDYKVFPTVSWSSSNKIEGDKSIQIATVATGAWAIPSGGSVTPHAGEIWIGTADDGGNHSSEGHAFMSRPSSISFWYQYAPVDSENFYMKVELKAEDGTILAVNEISDGVAESSGRVITLPFVYTTDGKKVSSIYMIFKSSTKDTPSYNTGVTMEIAGRDQTSHIGSVLRIDDIVFNYE